MPNPVQIPYTRRRNAASTVSKRSQSPLRRPARLELRLAHINVLPIGRDRIIFLVVSV